ncbi:putative glutamate carboxypeptidase [Hortaea werneckii]|nr:putative glutamate carboxypeptidase [Hortaea werneckii]
MYRSAQIAVFALLATDSYACQRERHFHHNGINVKRQVTERLPLSPDEATITSSFDNRSLSDWSYYYTHGDHIAGRNESQAQWTADRWSEAGIQSRLDTYNVFLNYPVNKSMTMTYANGSTFQPSLEEDELPEDETTTYPNRIPTFHGYSASGSAEAEFVYVGRGQQTDFERLIELGVELEGKIAISRYGGNFRGLKVKNAQDHGMIGAILFTDPADDGNVTVANGYAAYPDGPARNPSSVQRGSVQFLSTYPGDPTTPGYPSIGEDIPRTGIDEVTPQIPSIPISMVDAEPILAALNGSGPSGEEVGRDNWIGGLQADYSAGPAPGVTISMSNYMEGSLMDVWNAIGVINGTNSDETVVIGNHRDAWIIGGAADPNSGTAVIVELGRALGKLLSQGWQPKRNIVLCSWDAEEYGLLGSTEWVEEYIPWISQTAVSYLNIDVATSGPHPSISAVPELHALGVEMMKKVSWPLFGYNQTMYDVWYEDTEGEIGVLGRLTGHLPQLSGSDYTAFLHRGVASIDMGSDPGPTDPIYHYHSDYDSWHWMSTFGDPGFLVHKGMGQYLTLLAYHLATDESLPLEPVNFANEMDIYYQDLQYTIGNASQDVDISELRQAIDTFRTQAEEAESLMATAVEEGNSDLVRVQNYKFRDFHRGFTSQGGLPNREFYRHVIFAPGLDTGYAATTFPGITEAIEIYDNFTMAAEWVTKTSAGIRLAGNILKT